MREVVSHYILSALYVLIDFIAAWLLAWLAARTLPAYACDRSRLITFLLGTGLLLVAGIGRLGWSIQSIGGNTLPERLDQRIFFILSLLGTFLLIYHFALGWLVKRYGSVCGSPGGERLR